jgi:cobalamin biosynthesis Co2+ chelatase CbiK
MIIEKLKQRDNIDIDNPKEALKKLYKEGYQEVIVQPLHIINGSEFHDLIRTVKKFKNNFRSLKWGNALLSKTADYFDVAKILKTEVENNSEEEAVVLMGHGSSYAANSDYAALDYVLKERGMKDYYVGAVEGYPEIQVVIKQLKKKNYKKVKLAPLMLVAGAHAQNDMIGENEDSWKNLLENEGFEVEFQLKGLGEYEGIQNKYAEKVKSLLEK